MEIRQRTEQPAVEDFDCVKSSKYAFIRRFWVPVLYYYNVYLCVYILLFIIVTDKVNTKRAGTFEVAAVSIRLK